MVPSRLRPRQVPAALLVLVGLGITALAGLAIHDVTQEEYRYAIAELDDNEGVVTYAALSHAGQEAVNATLAADDNETVVTGDLGTAFSADGGLYLLRYRGSYHCVDVGDEGADTGVAISIDRDCRYLRVSGPPVHAFANLTEAGQTVFQRTLDDEDRERWFPGKSPPDFESGGDTPQLNDGVYYVGYQGRVLELTVSSSGGIGVAFVTWTMGLVAVVGLLLAAVGVHAFRAGLVRRPVSILAGVGVVLAPLGLPVPGIDGSDLFDLLLPAGVLVAAGVWLVVPSLTDP